MKASVIGAGRIARQHLACLKELPGVEIAAVCDLSPATAEAMAERYEAQAWFTDYRKMLETVRPTVVHITTPPPSHFALAKDAIAAGAHVLVEKPIAATYEQFLELRRLAEQRGVWLMEDHNLLFNQPVVRILDLIRLGDFGDVVHVEVMYCLKILGPGSPFADPNVPHPCLTMPGGVIADFLTHLSYLAYAFIGPHQSVRTIWQKRDARSPVPSDEFRALILGERGTGLIGFSAHSQPDGCWLWVHGTKMRALANLFEGRLTIDRIRSGPKPLMPLRNARDEARDVRRAAYRSLWRKLGNHPGAYEGLWALLAQLYRALANGGESPVPIQQVEEVSRLIADLTKGEYQQ